MTKSIRDLSNNREVDMVEEVVITTEEDTTNKDNTTTTKVDKEEETKVVTCNQELCQCQEQ